MLYLDTNILVYSLININDAIHLAFAERYATKLLTFDRDFKKLTAHTSMPIEILP